MAFQPKPLESWKDCKSLNHQYGQHIALGKQAGRQIGWMSATVPPEVSWAFDVVPVGGESYGAMTADWQQDKVDLGQASEEAGYSRDLCAYARISLGSMLLNQGPYGKFPVPDFVVGAKGECNIQIKWYEAIARRYPVPFFVLDLHLPDGGQHYLDYYVSQMHNYVGFLEEVTGTKTDEERFVKSVTTSFRSADIWDEVLELMKAKPCPISMKSLYSYMPAIVNLSSLPEALALLSKLRDELAQRVREGVGDVPDESIRLLWEGMPLWFKLDFIKYFHENGASFVANGTYLSIWGNIFRTWGEDSPAEFGTKIWKEPTSLQEAILQVAKRRLRRRGVGQRIKSTAKLAQDWDADGVIWHSNRGCKQLGGGEPDSRRALQEETGLPTLLLEASMADSRAFSESQMIARADAFLEQVRQRQRAQRTKQK